MSLDAMDDMMMRENVAMDRAPVMNLARAASNEELDASLS